MNQDRWKAASAKPQAAVSIKEVAEDILKAAKDCAKDASKNASNPKDWSTAGMLYSDASKILKVAEALRRGDVDGAMSYARDLETSARDRLPKSFYSIPESKTVATLFG